MQLATLRMCAADWAVCMAQVRTKLAGRPYRGLTVRKCIQTSPCKECYNRQ